MRTTFSLPVSIENSLSALSALRQENSFWVCGECEREFTMFHEEFYDLIMTQDRLERSQPHVIER
jgi:hypothetical protein